MIKKERSEGNGTGSSKTLMAILVVILIISALILSVRVMDISKEPRDIKLEDLPSDMDAETLDNRDSEDFSMASHTHDGRYYKQSEIDESFLSVEGGTIDGDLKLEDLEAKGTISGDGSGLTDLDADEITSGTISNERLPSNINADTLDNYDSSAFAMRAHTHDDIYYNKTEIKINYYNRSECDSLFGTGDLTPHTHDDRYYTKPESDSKFAMATHTHDDRYYTETEIDDNLYSQAQCNSLFSMSAHTHDERYYTETEIDNNYYTKTASNSLFAMAAHTHDERYYTESESDHRFVNRTGDNLTGDLEIQTLIAHGIINGDGSGLTNLNATRLSHGNIDSNRFQSGYGLIPDGSIVMWSGPPTNIPSGWHLCDGTSGTPDLRGRFIVGYYPSGDLDGDYDGIGAGETVDSGNTANNAVPGGEKRHTLDIDEMPSHTHEVTKDDYCQSGGTGDEIDPWDGDGYPTSPTGGDQPHENRPPYYVLAFIIKL